jgi:hypothetical protein
MLIRRLKYLYHSFVISVVKINEGQKVDLIIWTKGEQKVVRFGLKSNV